MAVFNSQVMRPQDILRGSGMLEVAKYGESDWFNIGAISNIIVDENFNVYTAEDDTVYEKDYVTNQNIKLSFVQHEALNTDVYNVIRGVDTITEVLDGTNEQIKIESGNLTDLNEIKARITTKIGGSLFYFIFYRGFTVKGKGFNYKQDAGTDDTRIKQNVEIMFMPDSANSDNIYYTLQPAVYNEKLHKVQGDPFNGITLFVGPSGNMPFDTWTLYDSETYDDSTYAPTGYYESRLMFQESSFSSITWTATGDANDIKFSYRHGNDPDNLTSWSAETNAIGSVSQSLTGKYLQYRFIFYSSYWDDSDSVTVNTIS